MRAIELIHMSYLMLCPLGLCSFRLLTCTHLFDLFSAVLSAGSFNCSCGGAAFEVGRLAMFGSLPSLFWSPRLFCMLLRAITPSLRIGAEQVRSTLYELFHFSFDFELFLFCAAASCSSL